MAKQRPCAEDINCPYPALPRRRKCGWHWLLKQPVEVQVDAAQGRLRAAEAVEGYQRRPRVKQSEWPRGTRWCSGCQSFIPSFYCMGSRCKACASRAAHAAHVKRTYDLDPAEYDALLAWQGGRCYLCGRLSHTKRLAVDHDHETNQVRGLLCADNERGCNHAVLGNIEASAQDSPLQMAKRVVQYLTTPPLELLRAGHPPVTYGPKREATAPDRTPWPHEAEGPRF